MGADGSGGAGSALKSSGCIAPLSIRAFRVPAEVPANGCFLSIRASVIFSIGPAIICVLVGCRSAQRSARQGYTPAGRAAPSPGRPGPQGQVAGADTQDGA